MMLHLKDSTGLPTGVEGMEEDCAPPPLLGGSSSKFGGGTGGGLSQDMGGALEGSQEMGKYLVNSYTIACRLKNVILLLR